MTGAKIDVYMSAAAGMEQRLFSALSMTTKQVARLESLDQEQRAEVYAILKAIEQDSAVHQAMADALAKLPNGIGTVPTA